MVVVSNGFSKFHLACTAAELHRLGMLSLLITGAYPGSTTKKALRLPLLKRQMKLNRLLAREEDIADNRVVSLYFPEIISAATYLLSQHKSISLMEQLNVTAFKIYGRQAVKIFNARAKGARIYHYRAGFGGDSVKAAKAAGMVALCDHSIAHPSVKAYLTEHQGKMPEQGRHCNMDRLQRWILADIEQADAVLVNSEFVRDTFHNRDWTSNNIHTIYWGVDDQFLQYVSTADKAAKSETGPLNLMFAGAFEKRKGADMLIKTLQKLNSITWRLEIAGFLCPSIVGRYPSFFRDDRVNALGILPRAEIAKRMHAAHVFFFPSLCEGSARVVFEALACGCYVITTPNSGSIVQDGIHGAVVLPSDGPGMAEAIRWAFINRRKVLEIGQQNAAIIKSGYTQQHYGKQIVRLYLELLQTHRNH